MASYWHYSDQDDQDVAYMCSNNHPTGFNDYLDYTTNQSLNGRKIFPYTIFLAKCVNFIP